MAHIAVIGAGQAGFSLVSKLRAEGFDGQISLFGDEPVPPYQRPPLSKKYLTGEMDLQRLFFRPENFYEDQGITLHLGRPVSAIDLAARTVTAGETHGFDQLAITTGSLPRRLPDAIGGALGGVHYVRSLADVDAMEPAFRAGAKVLIVGGGYIGLEAAAVAAQRGLDVTLVEAADRILQRVAAPQTSDFFRKLHWDNGVTIMEGTGLASLTGDDRVTGAVLADGRELAVDFVIAGIGILPDTAIAEAAGLVCDNGIAVDAHCATSDPAVFAAGDCASFPHQGGRLRLESVGNAIDMGECVAMNMLGNSVSYTAKPWFWSDQYDTTLQIAGLNTGYDQIVERPGARAGGMSVWYFAEGRLLAVDAASDPRSYMLGKRWIEAGVSPRAVDVEDASKELKTLDVS